MPRRFPFGPRFLGLGEEMDQGLGNNNNGPQGGGQPAQGSGLIGNTIGGGFGGEPRRSQRIAKNNFKRFCREAEGSNPVHRRRRIMQSTLLEPGTVPSTPLAFVMHREITCGGVGTLGRQRRSGARPLWSPQPPVLNSYLSKHMPESLCEHPLNIGMVDKVFAAAWLDEKQVVLGTKSNEVLVADVVSGRITRVPSLQSSSSAAGGPAFHEPYDNPCTPCGIHAVSVNPSQTRLATGGEKTNDLAIYKLPSFDPAMVGQRGHSDWIFDMVWVDDEACVTGSRDGRLAVWRDASAAEESGSHEAQYIEGVRVPEYDCVDPLTTKKVPQADVVRALAYNQSSVELGVLSLNSKIHLWDVNTFKHKSTRMLAKNKENVCMTFDPQTQVYAVGSQSYVSLVDSRTLGVSLSIESPHMGTGIRSVSFNDRILNIGTGAGFLFFYDMTAGKFLQRTDTSKNVMLSVGPGYLKEDDTWRGYFSPNDYKNAVYTHCYDRTRTRLFTAGGPLPTCLWGNYAAVWQ